MIYFQRRIYFTKVNIVWFGCFELFFICHGIVQYVLRIRPFIDRVQIRLYPAPDSSVSGSRFVYIRLQIRLYPAPDSSVSGSRSACIRLKIRIWLIYIQFSSVYVFWERKSNVMDTKYCNGKNVCVMLAVFFTKNAKTWLNLPFLI